jgi:hypothetical protein
MPTGAWPSGSSASNTWPPPTWDFWAAAEIDLDELRGRYGITPLEPADAAAGAEIVVAADADPDAR